MSNLCQAYKIPSNSQNQAFVRNAYIPKNDLSSQNSVRYFTTKYGETTGKTYLIIKTNHGL